MPITFGVTPEQIWSYAKRELTQAKFPFWSAIIPQTHSQVSVAAGATAVVDIQPPAGETWYIELTYFINTSALYSHVDYFDFDGTNEGWVLLNYTRGSYGLCVPYLVFSKIITNSNYSRLKGTNADSSAVGFCYGYSGFKLSKPHWTPNRLSSDPPRPWKRPTTQPLPSQISALQKYACEIFSHEKNDYELCIMLEEDTILAVDPNTNFPVERLTAYAKVDDFMNILKLRDNPLERPENQRSLSKLEYLKAIGWLKYFEKWAKEGITI